MKRGIFLLFAIIALVACTPRSVRWRQWNADPREQEKITATASEPQSRSRRVISAYDNWYDYLPDAEHENRLPMRQLRINFHIMNPTNPALQIKPDVAKFAVMELLKAANVDLDTNIRNWRSPNGTPVLPRMYRYKLWPQAGDNGIYFHTDDSLYYYVVTGEHQNNFDRTVIDKYGVGLDSIINVFIQPHHPDSVRSATYPAKHQAIALGTDTKLSGIFELGKPVTDARGMFNHEVGHILGLGHAWYSDGCDDTEDHPNRCWEWKTEGFCFDNATNNMMDYNAYQIAVTPCQIGKMHMHLNTEGSPMRALLVRDYCKIALEPIVVTDTLTLSGHRDIVSDIVVASGGVLEIRSRVSMPEGSKIMVQNGGKLILDGCRLHNACDLTWKGIYKQPQGMVEIRSTVVLQNVEPSRKK